MTLHFPSPPGCSDEEWEKLCAHEPRGFQQYLYDEFVKKSKNTDDHITKDSGTRRTFDTGSVRDAATGKGRFDLITPIALMRLAKLYERGAVKYDPRTWEKGQPLSETLDCAMRHLQKRLMGYRDEDHLAASAWNVFAIMHYEHQIERGFLPAELDNLPNYLTPEERENG